MISKATTANPKSASIARKKSTPTVAQSLRDREKKMMNEYYAGMDPVPMDLPRAIRFGSEADDIAELRM